MASTTFTTVLQGGPDNGLGPTLDTRVDTTWIRSVLVSARSRDTTITLPDNSYLHGSNNFVTVAVSSLGQGAKILLGDGSTDNLYGTTNGVVAVGVYASTLTQSAVSAKTISVKVTASVAASAADFTQGKFYVNIIGGIRRS